MRRVNRNAGVCRRIIPTVAGVVQFVDYASVNLHVAALIARKYWAQVQ